MIATSSSGSLTRSIIALKTGRPGTLALCFPATHEYGEILRAKGDPAPYLAHATLEPQGCTAQAKGCVPVTTS